MEKIMLKKHFTILLILGAQTLQAQIGKYLVLFKDKNNNTFSIDKPTEFLSARAIERRKKNNVATTAFDLPPTKSYVDGLKAAGATVWYTSRWLNAALVLADSATAAKIKALPYVKGFEANRPLNLAANGKTARVRSKFENEKVDSLNYGNATRQSDMIGIQNLHQYGIQGQNMLIAVLDDGFNKVDKNTYLKHLFDDKRVLSTYDFVRNTANVYDVGGHGNLVLGTMAANTNGKIIGTAPMASYALFRTEDAPTEKLIEEANYLFACEKADSLGADLINTSLGYTTYDYSGYNHSYTDMNGDKTLVTRAADWAARAGILACISAGNSGGDFSWPYIGAPADADSVITVGAVTTNSIKVGFSSIGPSADGRIKPDIAAMGSGIVTTSVNANNETVLNSASGTSFSSPIFCGLAACFWQYNNKLTMMQVREALLKLGNQANLPDNLLGYGIPKIVNLILPNEAILLPNTAIYPNPSSNQLFVKIPEKTTETSLSIQISGTNGIHTQLKSNQQNQIISLHISNLPPGMYIGRLILNGKAISFKFLKAE
jgi:serine protease AprX